MDVYSLKTSTDAFIWLSHLEGDLLCIRASQNAGLYPPYDDKAEEPEFECAVFNCGLACGEFIDGLEAGTIAPLTAAGKALFDTLNDMGQALCGTVWEQALNRGAFDAWADRAICAAGADGWIYN